MYSTRWSFITESVSFFCVSQTHFLAPQTQNRHKSDQEWKNTLSRITPWAIFPLFNQILTIFLNVPPSLPASFQTLTLDRWPEAPPIQYQLLPYQHLLHIGGRRAPRAHQDTRLTLWGGLRFRKLWQILVASEKVPVQTLWELLFYCNASLLWFGLCGNKGLLFLRAFVAFFT